MRLLLDANLSPKITERLREAGYDAAHVRDIDLLHASDEKIFDRASIDDWVVVPADTDFSMLLALMSSPYSSPPSNLRSLRDRLVQAAKREGLVFGRLQQHIAVLVVAQLAAQLADAAGAPLLLVKGGSSLELRRGIRGSRTSKDLDTVARHDVAEVHELLADAGEAGWEGFTALFTPPEEIDVPGLLIKPTRFVAKLSYRGQPFASVPIEVSTVEAGNAQSFDAVASDALTLVGVPVAVTVPCMTLPWQIAQKLHACTAPLPAPKTNDRAHDLVDLQLLEVLLADAELQQTRLACVAVFESRAEQPWPPTIRALPHWPAIYDQARVSRTRLAI